MTLKSKINLSIVIFLLLGVCLVIFIINPVYKEIETSSEAMISQKQKIVAMEGKIKNIEDFRRNYQTIKENLDKTEDLFINPDAPVEFISFLEENSQICQVPIEISPSTAKKDKGDAWPSITFRINSTSPFTNFLRFLERLESSPYLVSIDKLDLKRLGEKDLKSKDNENLSIGAVKASLSIKVFTK